MRPLPASAANQALSVATAIVRAVTVTLSRGDETVTVEPDSGSFTQDARRSMRWNGSISVSSTQLTPTSPRDILTPFGTRAQVMLGIRLGGLVSQVAFGQYIVSQADVQIAPTARTVTVTLVDLAEAIAGYRFESPFTVAGGTDIADVVNAVISDRTWDNPQLEATGQTISRQRVFGLDPEKDPWRELTDLVAGFGMRLWYNRDGQLVLDSEPLPTAANAIELVGPVSITGTFEKRPPNVVVARGQPADPALLPVQAIAMDTDPSSPTYAGPAPGNSPYGRITRFYASPLLTDENQAAAAAQTILAQTIGGGASWEFSRAFDPTWDPDDVVLLDVNGRPLIVVADAVTVDLGGLTTVVAREVAGLVPEVPVPTPESPGESPAESPGESPGESPADPESPGEPPEPESPGEWGEFPTHLNAGWADWNLDEAPLTGSAAYEMPPAMPTLESVPGDAIAVNPGNVAAQVNANPAGSKFRLLPGTYRLTIPVKAGNEYWGDPGDWEAVIIDGQNTRHNAFGRSVANVKIRYLTWQYHLGTNAANNAAGAVDPGANGWDIRGVVMRWNRRSGIRPSGMNGRLYHFIAYQNGQQAIGGPASGWIFDCGEIYENGTEDALPGNVDLYPGSDRGGCKIGQNYNLAGTSGGSVTVRRIHSWGHDQHGWWHDIRIEDTLIEYCWIEGNRKKGINLEAGRPGGLPIVVRWNRLEDNAFHKMNPSNDWWRAWFAADPMNIGVSVCQNVEVYGNVSIGFRGIGSYNWAHHQMTGVASTPGSDGTNASTVKNLHVHHNYIYAGGIAAPDCTHPIPNADNPGAVAAGLTQLSTAHPLVNNAYLPSENNRWEDNIYAGTHKFNWGTVGHGSSGCRTPGQWAAAGMS